MEVYVDYKSGKLVYFQYGGMYEALNDNCLSGYMSSREIDVYTKKCTKPSDKEAKAIVTKHLKGSATASIGGHGHAITTTGADPEVFIVKDGKVVPAWEVVPTKQENIYPDGFALEIGAAAGGCFSYVCDSVQRGLVLGHRKAKAVGAKLYAEDVMPIDQEVLNSAPEKHVQLGCAPSYNAYGEAQKMPTGRNLPFRTTGTHFHYGSGALADMGLEDMHPLVRCVEAMRVPIFTAAFGHLEHPQRRTLYGRIGEFRKPKWGLEMRSTGAVVIRHPALYHFVTTITRYCLDKAMKLGPDSIPRPRKDTIQNIGNNSDVASARRMLTAYPVYAAILRSAFSTIYDGNAFSNDMLQILAAKGGLANEMDITKPDVVSDNWKLEGYWTGHSDGVGCNVGSWYANVFRKKAKTVAAGA